ncbi:MAG: hypothetical protein U0Q18_23780 [Bryobacteraceae bacterium]
MSRRNRNLAFLLLLLVPALSGAPVPRSWIAGPKPLSNAVIDGNPQTYELLCKGPQNDPCDIGLEWESEEAVGEFSLDYATLGGRAYEPAPAGQKLEYWTGSDWQAIAAAIEIDYRNQSEFAPLEGSGTARWTYRFSALRTTRLRVVLTQPANLDPGHRCYAVRDIRSGPGAAGRAADGFHILGTLPKPPEWLASGANMAVAEAGAQISLGNPAEVRWPRRLLVNSIRVQPAGSSPRVEWWDGSKWRAVEPLAASQPAELRFLPVSTERLRVSSSARLQKVEARLDTSADRYFSEIEHSRVDLLGERFRGMPRPDLAAAQALLLPLDFAKTAIGRPADKHETIVLWNGTFLMAEPSQPGKEVYDRWFAPAAGPQQQVFGTDWMQSQARYLDGYLPATVTTYQQGDIAFEQKVYVTAPGSPLYGTVAEVMVTNRSRAPRQTTFTLAMGRRRNQIGPGPQETPFYFDPQVTGYELDPAERAVLSPAGEVMLYADTPGRWEGTARENHLSYPLSLAPGESRTLRFFVPSVDEPLKTADGLREFAWQKSLEDFRAWWKRELTSGMQIELPEAQFNDVYKNLLAQSLIITLDDSLVRYGAYFYESYFGVEEGWPAVALAQYGYPEAAQKILSIMLSPELMDKKNYHHQYRNGLEPWYAATIYRLTRDRAWLEGIAPDLKAAAEWTLRVTGENQDSKYPGILPRHSYGGDIDTPAYSFYANATCWRGLHDTALAFRVLGREEEAQKYQQAADAYRHRLLQLADQISDRSSTAPFIPMAFEIGSTQNYREREPSYDFLGINVPANNTWIYLGNYWNLFAPMMLEVNLFPSGDPRARWIPDYMDKRGGILMGLARFTLGLDQIYGKGYYESLLEEGRRAAFQTSLYGIFAHGMSQNLNSFPEVAGIFPLRTSNSAMWREHQRNLWNWYFEWGWGFEGWQNCEGEPLSAGPGMALQTLRMALLRESIETEEQDTLRLLDGAPAHWFEPGKRIVVKDASTFFGKISFETEGLGSGVRARITRPKGFDAHRVILRLPRAARNVTIGGQPWSQVSGEEVTLPEGESIDLVATFQ